MIKWEYLIRDWSFRGPREDDWPERNRYLAAVESFAGSFDEPNAANWSLIIGPLNDYQRWRDAEEVGLLNELGAAGFELVSIARDERRNDATVDDTRIRVFCYMKRQVTKDAPEPTGRTIGFHLGRPPGAGDE